MKQEKITLYTYAKRWSFENEFSIITSTHLPSSSDGDVVIPITDIEVSIPVPEIDRETLVNGEIEILKGFIKVEQKKSFERQKYWEDRISKLQAIESK